MLGCMIGNTARCVLAARPSLAQAAFGHAPVGPSHCMVPEKGRQEGFLVVFEYHVVAAVR